MKMLNSLAAALAVVLALPVHAATPIDQRHPASADVQVRVENISGSVVVRSGTGEAVVITGTLGEGAKPLRVDGDAKRLTIRVEAENGSGRTQRMDDTHLEITMPGDGRLEAHTVSADVEVTGIQGGVELESVSGDIRYVGDSARVHLKSVSGDVIGEGAGRDWTVGTVSGDIRLPRAAGSVRADTVSGLVELVLGDIERVRAESVSGALSATGPMTADGSLAMQSVSGAIVVELAEPLNARVRASTFSGRVDSSVGTPEKAGIGGGYRLEAVSGSGTGDVRLESFSGRIRINAAN
jgi:DUF4097 and DUF4098 domain-containing protein YvlB